MLCKQCVRESLVDNIITRLPLQNPSEHIIGTEDAMQIDLVREVTRSGGYENIVTAIDVYSRHLFAYPIGSQDTETVARDKISIITKHAFFAVDSPFGQGTGRCTPSFRTSSNFFKNYRRSCHDQTCADDWNAKTNTCITQKGAKPWNRWRKINVA